MATYYGMGPDGQLGHLRLRESMEEWHVRCIEQRELIRRLRADVGTEYSRKANYRDIKALQAAVEELRQDAADARTASNMLTAGMAILAECCGIDAVIAPIIDGEVRLPCPEHGEECSNWPRCTD
jgi:hypothetical protein